MAFLRLTILILFFSSCSDHGIKPESRSEQLSGTNQFGKTWQIQRIEVELGTLIPKTCLTDNFITYYPNGTYEINEGATKCTPDDPPGLIGNWSLDRSENRLIVEISDSTQIWDIDQTNVNSHRITSSFKEGHRSYSFILSK